MSADSALQEFSMQLRKKQTLLTIGIFAVIGMASTGVAVVWFGGIQLPQRECSAIEAVQKKALLSCGLLALERRKK